MIFKNRMYALLMALLIFGVSQAQEVQKDNTELQKIYDRDQGDRFGNHWEGMAQRDSLRRKRVLELIDSTKVRTAQDHINAAMVFQHGNDTIDSGRAVALMEKAVAKDSTINKWLLAAAIDRDLMRKNKPQIYGTQYVKNSQEEPFKLYKLDSTQITDAQRGEYNVRTLAEQREQVKMMNKKSLAQLFQDGRTVTEILNLIKTENPEDSEYNLSEEAINGFGYFLLNDDKIKEAVKILKRNTELYPKAANTYDSYGEALLKAGQKKKAIKAYEKSLKLDPENQHAKDVINSIKNERL